MTGTVERIQESIGRSHYHQLFRPRVLEADPEAQRLRIKVLMRREFERQPDTGQWHGGVIASLVDIAGCYALMLSGDRTMLTLNFSTDFLRLAQSDELTATALVRRSGRTAGFVDVEIHDGAEALIAVGRACYALRPPQSTGPAPEGEAAS